MKIIEIKLENTLFYTVNTILLIIVYLIILEKHGNSQKISILLFCIKYKFRYNNVTVSVPNE